MRPISFARKLSHLFIFALGLWFYWLVSFYKPFSSQYPPASTHLFLRSGNPAFVKASPGKHYERSRIGEFFLGKHYRFYWSEAVEVPVFDLARQGMKIERKGGGMQTTSFTLTNPAGQAYALRSVDKDPVNVIPKALFPTILTAFIRDQVSATDPYAALVVSNMARAAQISQTRSQLYYILPQDPAFKTYQSFAGGFYTLTRKIEDPSAFQEENEVFSGFYDSEEMLETLRNNPHFAHLDTAFYLRCRLFDLFIGDWDRHAGQWDWLAFSAGNHTIFRPVPKDRDQALGYYEDGLFPWILTRPFLVKKITSFTPDYTDVAGFAQNGMVLDRKFLHALKPPQYQLAAQQLQTLLSDQVLTQALAAYPEPVRRNIFASRLAVLKSRRNQLPQAALIFQGIVANR